MARQCRYKSDRVQTEKKVNEVLLQANCPSVGVTFGSVTVQAIVDTGASVSCVGSALLEKAFQHGYELELSGPASVPLPTSGTINSKLRLQGTVFGARLHVLDTDVDDLLLGKDFMSQFEYIGFKPKQNELEFGRVLSCADSVATVRCLESVVIPPRSQKVLHVRITPAAVIQASVDESSQVSDVVVERDEDFESKTGLFVGRCVTSLTESPIVVLNPGVTR